MERCARQETPPLAAGRPRSPCARSATGGGLPLLREELREVTLYYVILTAVAAGHTTVQEIARQAGQDPRGLAYYLQQLIELGYIERRYP